MMMPVAPPLDSRPVRELSSLELLAAVLRGSTTPEASSEVPKALRALATEDALVVLALDPDFHGLSPRSRLRLEAAIELGLRVACELSACRAPPLPHPEAVAAWGHRLLPLAHEELWMLALDGQNGLRAARRIATGGLHGLHVGLGEPVRAALRAGASAFVLLHNHPSGDPTPSEEDEQFTFRVAAAAQVVGVPLIDHVIVARGGHASLLERGALPVVPSS